MDAGTQKKNPICLQMQAAHVWLRGGKKGWGRFDHWDIIPWPSDRQGTICHPNKPCTRWSERGGKGNGMPPIPFFCANTLKKPVHRAHDNWAAWSLTHPGITGRHSHLTFINALMMVPGVHIHNTLHLHLGPFGKRFYPKAFTISTIAERDSNISLWYTKTRIEHNWSIHNCKIRFKKTVLIPKEVNRNEFS